MKRPTLLCLLALITLMGCSDGGRYYDSPAAIAMSEAAGSPVASMDVENVDGRAAMFRLYRVPRAYAALAASDIRAADGLLNRWALFTVGSMGRATSGAVRLTADAGCCERGDLLILAIDPVSPGYFRFSNTQISSAETE